MGVFKIVIMLLISFAGFGALAGRTKVEVPNNFANAFEGSRNDMFGIASCIYNVSLVALAAVLLGTNFIPAQAGWSYVGYSTAYYSMGEVKSPVRTIKIAGPLAILVSSS